VNSQRMSLLPQQTVPANPCTQAGNAPDPSAYAARGQASANALLSATGDAMASAPIAQYVNLLDFRRGGSLDAQPLGGSQAYGNYVFGAYVSAAGISLSTALTGANAYAAVSKAFNPKQYSNQQMDSRYTAIPAANVANITNGYNAQQNGTLCHK
jgi:hypothetical protein